MLSGAVSRALDTRAAAAQVILLHAVARALTQVNQTDCSAAIENWPAISHTDRIQTGDKT
jgi:predicted GTPase